jgi:hypothetical protein
MNPVRRHTKFILITVATILIGVVVWWYLGPHSKRQTSTPEPGSIQDVAKPTQEEQQAADAQKDRNIERENLDKTPPASGQKKTVTPIITFLDQIDNNIEAGALISGVYESGGTCTFTATLGSYKVEKQSAAVQNPSTTDCKPFAIPVSEFPAKGTWSVVIAYESAAALGTSQPKQISIK